MAWLASVRTVPYKQLYTLGILTHFAKSDMNVCRPHHLSKRIHILIHIRSIPYRIVPDIPGNNGHR
jgi:hypothetical protein